MGGRQRAATPAPHCPAAAEAGAVPWVAPPRPPAGMEPHGYGAAAAAAAAAPAGLQHPDSARHPDNVRVAVRVRPMNAKVREHHSPPVAEVCVCVGGICYRRHPPPARALQEISGGHTKCIRCGADGSVRVAAQFSDKVARDFDFHSAIDEECAQAEFFETSGVRRMLDAVPRPCAYRPARVAQC